MEGEEKTEQQVIRDLENDDAMAHLDDAREFFGKEESQNEEKQKQEQKGTEKNAEKVSEADELLKSVVNPGKREEEATKSDESSSSKAPDDDSDLTPPPDDSPQKANWDIMKQRKNEAVAKVKELEAQLEAKADDVTTESLRARVKELEGENDRFSSRLKELDFKSHPEYFEQYEKPIQDAQEELKAIAEGEDLEVNVESLAALSGRDFAEKVDDIIDGMSKFNGNEFARVARQLQKTIKDRDTVAADSDKFIQDANERLHAQTREIFDNVTNGFSQTLIPMELPEGADDAMKQHADAYNADLAEVPRLAEQIAFGQMDHEQLARISNEAAHYRFVMARVLPRLAENAAAKVTALQAELDGIKKAGPKYSPANTTGRSMTMSDMGHEEAAEAAFRA